MSPYELRLGNYVQDLNGEVYQVSKIYLYLGKPKQFKTNKVGMWKDNVYKEKGFDLINGVPITEEWLKKLGFKYQVGVDLYKKDGLLITTNFIILLGNHWVNLKYVHQLQNLYFTLTNQELNL